MNNARRRLPLEGELAAGGINAESRLHDANLFESERE
jgi:hypothetical protein